MRDEDMVTIGEVYRGVQRIEHQLNLVTGDHEQRLRRLERWHYAIPPTVILGAASVVATIFRT